MAERSIAQTTSTTAPAADLLPPPPYVESEGHAPQTDEPAADDDSPPSYTHSDGPSVPAVTDEKRRPSPPTAPATASSAVASSSSSSSSSFPSSSSSSNPLSFIKNAKQAYEARQAAKKVDFYERIYGFVPKNVMSEGEWKRAREAAPKVKKEGGGIKATVAFGPR